jgi:hypothetical protein
MNLLTINIVVAIVLAINKESDITFSIAINMAINIKRKQPTINLAVAIVLAFDMTNA